MSVLVYGIVEQLREAVTGIGLDQQPLRAITAEGLAAIVSEHEPSRPDPDPAALLEYEQIIERLMDDHPIVPARFGSLMPDEQSVRAMLERRREDLLARLKRVADSIELGLRAQWSDEREGVDGERPMSGTAYLQGRLERRRGAALVAATLEPLAELSGSRRRQLVPRPELPVLDAYLVDRRRVDEFVALVAQLDDRLDGVELVCSGPWPPYSFAEGEPI